MSTESLKKRALVFSDDKRLAQLDAKILSFCFDFSPNIVDTPQEAIQKLEEEGLILSLFLADINYKNSQTSLDVVEKALNQRSRNPNHREMAVLLLSTNEEHKSFSARRGRKPDGFVLRNDPEIFAKLTEGVSLAQETRKKHLESNPFERLITKILSI